MIHLTDIVWKGRFVEKLAKRHGVSVKEVEEVVFGQPLIARIARGHVVGEDLYEAFGQTQSGRFMVVFFIRKGVAALPISARDMTRAERRYYEKNK